MGHNYLSPWISMSAMSQVESDGSSRNNMEHNLRTRGSFESLTALLSSLWKMNEAKLRPLPSSLLLWRTRHRRSRLSSLSANRTQGGKPSHPTVTAGTCLALCLPSSADPGAAAEKGQGQYGGIANAWQSCVTEHTWLPLQAPETTWELSF